MRSWRVDRPGRIGVGIAVTIVALAAVGCGNAKQEFRVDKLNPLVERLTQERARFATLLRGARPKRNRDAALLRAQVLKLAEVARRVARLRPPAGIEPRFRRYTRANAAVVASLLRYVDAFASGSLSRQRTSSQEVKAAVARANRAQTDLQHALR